MLKFRKLSGLVVAVFFCTIWLGSAIPQAQAAGRPNDINGHWAQAQIENVILNGVVAGYPDGSYQPEAPVTRAEFIAMVNRTFNFTTSAAINYVDVSPGDWFAADIAKAQARGYIAGNPDGTMKPDNQITRQEMATIMANVLQLTAGGSDELLRFRDASAVPAWSRAALAAMVREGYLSGNPDGTIMPLNQCSRAMAAVVLNKALEKRTTVYNTPGIFGPETGTITIDGNVVVNVGGVTLRNLIINGNLIIAPSVGQANVILQNATVAGTTIINGGDTSLSGRFARVLMRENHGLVVVNAEIDSLEVSSPTVGANLELTGSHIGTVTVAAGTSGTRVNIAKGMVIDNFYSYAPLDATGDGTVLTSYVFVSEITSTLTPGIRIMAPGVNPPRNPNSNSSGNNSGGSVSSRPTLSHVSIGGISPVTTVTPAITGTAAAPILTFTVNSASNYTTGTATLSKHVNYRVEAMGISYNDTASPGDDLAAMAFDLMDLFSATPGDGALGSNLISISPVTLTLTSGSQQTVYTILFK